MLKGVLIGRIGHEIIRFFLIPFISIFTIIFSILTMVVMNEGLSLSMLGTSVAYALIFCGALWFDRLLSKKRKINLNNSYAQNINSKTGKLLVISFVIISSSVVTITTIQSISTQLSNAMPVNAVILGISLLFVSFISILLYYWKSLSE